MQINFEWTMGRESMSFCDLLCLRSWIYIKKKYVFLKHKTYICNDESDLFIRMRANYLCTVSKNYYNYVI